MIGGRRPMVDSGVVGWCLGDTLGEGVGRGCLGVSGVLVSLCLLLGGEYSKEDLQLDGAVGFGWSVVWRGGCNMLVRFFEESTSSVRCTTRI